jgi:hypothetical protein
MPVIYELVFEAWENVHHRACAPRRQPVSYSTLIEGTHLHPSLGASPVDNANAITAPSLARSTLMLQAYNETLNALQSRFARAGQRFLLPFPPSI